MNRRDQWTIAPLRRTDAEWWLAWDRLNDAHFGGHPLATSIFQRALCEHFGHERLHSATFARAERPVFQALVEPTAFGRWAVFCPAQSGIGSAVFDRGAAPSRAELGRAIAALPGLGLALTFPYQDPLYSVLPAADDAALQRMALGTTMTVKDVASFDKYWADRPKELRDNLRRRMKRPAQDGLALRLDVLAAPDAVGPAVDRYGLLESAGWKGAQGTALHPQNAQGAFYRTLFTSLAAKGSAAVAELYFDDKLVASRLLVSGPAMHVVLKTTHDEELKRYAPGHVQLYLLLERLLGAPNARPIEFYTKASRDWLLWATDSRVMSAATLYRNALVAKLAARRRAAPAAESATEGAGSGSSD
jgi:hypothetical protein